jgi:exodeoxyribonuclease VII small subunit
MSQKQESYRNLRQELDEILSSIQSGDLEIDEATKQYERAMDIVAKLEKYLNEAENKITKVQKSSKRTGV